jgi:hypothetical protein
VGAPPSTAGGFRSTVVGVQGRSLELSGTRRSRSEGNAVPADPSSSIPNHQHVRRAGRIGRPDRLWHRRRSDDRRDDRRRHPPHQPHARGHSVAGLTSDYASPVVAGLIETDEIRESSGLSASECQDVLWTHNDSGNDPLVYAMSTEGRHLGTWRVDGAQNVDWESVATYKEPGTAAALRYEVCRWSLARWWNHLARAW